MGREHQTLEPPLGKQAEHQSSVRIQRPKKAAVICSGSSITGQEHAVTMQHRHLFEAVIAFGFCS